MTANNRLMGRVVENRGLYVLPRNFPEFAWTRVRTNLHIVVEDTHIVSPAIVNTFRVGLYKEKFEDGGTVYGVTPFKGDEAVAELGLQGVNAGGYSAQGFPRMDISGYPTLFTTAGGVGLDDHNWGFADTVTWSRGRHILRAGGEYKPQSRFQGNVPEGTYGSFSFTVRSPGTATRISCWDCRSRARVSIPLRTEPYVTANWGFSSRIRSRQLPGSRSTSAYDGTVSAHRVMKTD